MPHPLRRRRLLIDDIPKYWNLVWTGATWAVTDNRASNTPTLGSDVITNGTFASDTSWTKGTGWTISGGTANKASGAIAQVHQSGVLTIDRWYQANWDISSHVAGPFASVYGSTAQRGPNRQAVGSYTDANRAITVTLAAIRAMQTDTEGSVDNVVYREITLSTLFRTVEGGRSSLSAEARVDTVATGGPIGVVSHLDSTSSPANFVIAYRDGTDTLYLDKCVGGTYTNLITASIAFIPNAYISIQRPSGNTFRVLYNNSIIGTPQTINDAGIISNTKYGLFSTLPDGVISRFRLDGFIVPL